MVKATGQSNVGPRGPEGPAGANGTNGVDGDSAYEVAVANGFVGTEAEWLASLVGPQGPEGNVEVHTHPISEVTDLQTTLDSKGSATDVTNLQSDVSTLETDLAALDTANTTAHTTLQTNIDAKADATHEHDAGDTTTGTFADARIPSLNASKINAGTFALSRIPTGTSSTTVALGNRGAPSGGGAGTVLKKNSATDYDFSWGYPISPSIFMASLTTATTILSTDGETTLVTTNITLANGIIYLVEVDAWVDGEGFNGALASGAITISIDGTDTTSPNLTFEQGVNTTKIQMASSSMAGNGLAKAIDFTYTPNTGDLRAYWAKMKVRYEPTGSL